MAVSTQIVIKKPGMNSLLFYFFDKWMLIGLGGSLLNIASLLSNADLPDITGFSGLAIVATAVFQKVRDDMRKQKKFKLQMKIVEKMLNKEIELDKSVIAQFMGDDEK